MLIAPHFGLCACGSGGGQKFPLGLCLPVQGFLSFLGMWAKDYRKVNMRERQHSLSLLPRCAWPWDLLLFPRSGQRNVQPRLIYSVFSAIQWVVRWIRVDRRATALTFTNVLF